MSPTRAIDRDATEWVAHITFTREEVKGIADGQMPADLPAFCAELVVSMDSDAATALEAVVARGRRQRRTG